MKYTVLSLALLASLSMSTVAVAGEQTVTLGYAQSKVQDFQNIRGVNVKYRYEWNSPVSVIGSFTYLSGSGDLFGDDSWEDTQYDDNADVKYYSLLVGPAYRINEYVSFYALGGIGRGKVDITQNYHHSDYTYTENDSDNTTEFAYGAGVQINPTENIAIDLGYEGGKINDAKLNGFNISVGYRF